MAKYLTVRQYSKERNLSPWTVYRMVDRDEIEYERFGRAIRIRVERGPTRRDSPGWRFS